MHKRKGVDICVRAMSVLHTSINLEKNKIEKNTGVTDELMSQERTEKMFTAGGHTVRCQNTSGTQGKKLVITISHNF